MDPWKIIGASWESRGGCWSRCYWNWWVELSWYVSDLRGDTQLVDCWWDQIWGRIISYQSVENRSLKYLMAIFLVARSHLIRNYQLTVADLWNSNHRHDTVEMELGSPQIISSWHLVIFAVVGGWVPLMGKRCLLAPAWANCPMPLMVNCTALDPWPVWVLQLLSSFFFGSTNAWSNSLQTYAWYIFHL